MAVKKKKPTKRQIDTEVARAANDFDHLTHALWQATMENTAARLGVEVGEIEESFAALT